jgi:preprotein translocase subunit SecF
MLELIKNTNIDFLGKKNIAFIVSGILSIIGVIAIVQIATGKANLGIDFAGGTSLQLKFERTVNLHEVRKALDDGGIRDYDLQDFPAVKKILIRVKSAEQELAKVSDKVTGIVGQKFPDNKFVVESKTSIGPKVGGRLRIDSAWAVAMATLGILLYIAIRFKFDFAVGATVATFHDVLAVLAIFFLMGKEINLILITALLTIAGYSLTDTVVVFDRIRENLRTNVKDPVEKVMNRSVNEVLSRTLVTSFTVFLSSLSLFLFGGEVLHDFSLAMIFGLIIGTYSSIFVASPIVLIWRGKKGLVRK